MYAIRSYYEGASVEGMAEGRLFCSFLAETAFKPVGLESFEVGGGAYLEPSFLGGRPYLEVVCHCRGERHVAATQPDDPVWQLKTGKQALNMFNHLLQGFILV